MEMIPLKATARSSDVSANDLRRKGGVPCVLYGNEVKNAVLQCAVNELTKVYVKAGESTLVELDLDGKKVPVLFHALQFEPASGIIAHVDFYAVNLKKEIEAPVPIRLTGTSLAVKELAGVLVTVQNHVTVRCLPTALPHALEASLEKLTQIHDVITVADLVLPAGVKVQDAPETVLATVQEQRKEEEVQPAAPAEGAVAAEGAAPAEGAAAAPAEGESAAPAKKEKKGKEE
ncbi:MAG: 50S ribosomal protein L25 [Candidatus Peribacteraceae bacterium]|nr:50S ribosomal protein L25 [Candidatus Peribacteraceae bacterium]